VNDHPAQSRIRGTLAACAALAALPGAAQTVTPADAAPAQSVTVTVTATRVATPAYDVPASIDSVSVDPDGDGKPGVNISESLGGVPGLLARDRQNYAQDVQISVRGFGARSTFGIRGVRLYVDGIPATLPDGQGQISNVDLGSASTIEVLRGPFSALYGNSSGGVLQVFTENGAGSPRVTFGAGSGSDGRLRLDAKLSGATGTFGYVASASHFETNGYRDHSAVARDIGNVKLTLAPDGDSKFTLVGNAVSIPEAQDPLGLSRAELAANPRGVDPSAIAFDTRKSLSQTQLGLIWERRFGAAGELRALAYGGQRETTQYQAIPVAAQANPQSAGGLIDLARDYHGADLRWTSRFQAGAQRIVLIGGLAWDALLEHRQGYENFVNPGPVTGVQGALRRDETNSVVDVDPYVQAEWHPNADWTLDAGVRRSNVRFVSHDRYVTDRNPDDSGRANYEATLPVAGMMFALRPEAHLYVTAGRGFETPTLNELGYRPNGQTGLNFDLRPARSDSVEAGLKTRSELWGELNVAVFSTRTRDEIATLSNTGGRSTFQNVASTRRRGLEVEWTKALPHDTTLHASYTLLDARYTEGFLTCTATPCAAPSVPVADGNRIPGIARNAAFVSLAWQPPRGWRASLELQGLDHVEVNDTNTDATAAYAIANVGVGYVLPLERWQLTGFARIDNVTDRRYVGSVIVNEGNSRFFEPAPGRSFFGGVSATYTF